MNCKSMIVAVALMGALTGVARAASPVSSSDSLAYYIGRTQGASLANSQSKLSTDSYVKQFMEGWRTMMMADTTKVGFYDGVSVAMVMIPELKRMGDAGFPVNRKVFIEEFLKAYEQPKIVTEDDFVQFGNLMVPVQKRFVEIQREQEEKQARAEQAKLQANFDAAVGYLERLKIENPSAVFTESGMAYEVLSPADGPRPEPDSKVLVNYQGHLIDGTVFDQTEGEPRKFRVDGLIRGFTEGLLLMNKGSKFRFFIPPQLGYGPKALGDIPGNALLIFDVELVDIVE